MIYKILSVAIGYVFGLIETGMIYGKLANIDIKGQGSHNTGATNSLRVGGKKAGIIVLCGDILKCLIPAILAGIIFGKDGNEVRLFELYAGLGAILGHNFPFYNGFKGGKGVACTCAVCFLVDWMAALPALIVFIVIVLLTGYVSLGSIVSVVSVLIFMLIHNFAFDAYQMSASATWQFFIMMTFIAIIVIARHHANISRLLAGTENKFTRKK